MFFVLLGGAGLFLLGYGLAILSAATLPRPADLGADRERARLPVVGGEQRRSTGACHRLDDRTHLEANAVAESNESNNSKTITFVKK